MSVTTPGPRGSDFKDDPHYQERVDLAAVFRWTARMNMHEAVANHFSLSVSEDGTQFLVNPRHCHFSRVKASELLLVDGNDPTTMDRPDAPEATAWYIHGAMHRSLPKARCLLHVHSKYSTALASLKDCSMPAIDQNTARYFNRIAVDTGFGGMGVGTEAERLVTTLGDKNVLIMGNHGVMVAASHVADAFDDLYYFERACETLITALSTGRELNVMSDEIAELTAQQWAKYGSADAHLEAIKKILDEEEPDYRT